MIPGSWFHRRAAARRSSSKSSRRHLSARGTARTAQFLDDIKTLGFQSAYKGWSMGLRHPGPGKRSDELVLQSPERRKAVTQNYQMGLITTPQPWVIDIWTRINQITKR
jgi:DNA-directed RNA polymerase subunit beta'